MDEDLFNRYVDFFSNGTKFDSALAASLWNPHANAYYITTCIFWIVSMITLAIIDEVTLLNKSKLTNYLKQNVLLPKKRKKKL